MKTNLSVLLLVCFTDVTGVMEELADVITSLSQRLGSKCVVLHPSLDVATPRLVKRLTSLQVFLVFSPLDSSHDLLLGCHRPLTVLPFDSRAETPSWRRPTNQTTGRRLQSVWLQFLDPGVSMEEWFEGVDIPFDCEFLVAQRVQQGRVNLTEVYRVREGLPLQSFHFGSWTPGHGLEVTQLGLYERRNNLQGVVLRAVVMLNTSSVELDEQHNPKLIGYDGKIVTILSEELNFTLNVTLQTDSQWGKPLPDGSWDGMIGRIIAREVDIGVNSMFYSTLRHHVIDYTTPTSERVFRLFVRMRDKRDVKWDYFLKPFSRRLWAAIIAAVVVLGMAVGALYRLRCHYHKDKENHLNYFNSCFCVLSLFLQQGSEITSGPASCQIIFLTAMISSVILMSAYSGTLISFLTVEDDRDLSQGISGLLADKTYSAGVFYVPQEFYNRNINMSGSAISHRLSELILAERTPPTSVLEGLLRVCASKFALLVPEDAARAEIRNIPCRLRPIVNVGFRASQALPLPKHSPYRTLFNYVLHGLKSDGVIAKLLLDSQQWEEPRKKNYDVISVQLEDVAPVLVLLLAGVFLAAAFLAAEQATDRLSRRNRGMWKDTRRKPFPWTF